jgi:hypothetical protein
MEDARLDMGQRTSPTQHGLDNDERYRIVKHSPVCSNSTGAAKSIIVPRSSVPRKLKGVRSAVALLQSELFSAEVPCRGTARYHF